MKYYSEFTQDYVRDICNALNNAGILMRVDHEHNTSYAPENFKTLTEFLHSHVVSNSKLFEFLNQKGLVNRNQCPYTGQQINTKSPNWSYFNRAVYVSSEGMKIMQREQDENFKELFGTNPPQRRVSGNQGYSVTLLVGIILICLSIAFVTQI